MRHARVCLLILICCLIPLTAYAENKKIVIPCTGLTAIEIEQPPPGYLFDAACGDKCFYIVFIMEDAVALRVNRGLNAYKNSTRELYIGERLLTVLEPFHIDLPYSQKASSAPYSTLKDAVDEARRFCPNAVIKEPKTVRR